MAALVAIMGTLIALWGFGGPVADIFSRNGDAPPPAQPVRVDLGSPRRAEMLAAGAVSVQLRDASGGPRTLVAALELHGGRLVPLGPSRSITATAGRWQAVSVPLDEAGRARLARCQDARLAVTIRDPGVTTTAPLPRDPPDCGRFFGSRAVWNTPLPDDAPLDRDSAAITATLRSQVEAGRRSGPPPSINTTSYAPPIYTVVAAQPKVAVALAQPPGYDPALAAAFAQVPLPPDARPSRGSDGELVVWQPATDTMWEFWQLRRVGADWHASWGGRLDRVTGGPGVFTAPHANWGTTASSLPLAGGLILPHELESGRIDHALSMAVLTARAEEFSLPAQRTDGRSNCRDSIPEGARFRLDPALDVDALGLPPVTAALARAAQRYGIFVRDQAGAVVFYAQNPSTMPVDPYPVLFGGRSPHELVDRFPWSHLQLLRMDLARSGGPRAPIFGGRRRLAPCRSAPTAVRRGQRGL